jgi:glycosyltransferase involved in cell wall biosynthesis
LGYVSDLNKLYAKTSVAVCPIRIGTGSRHKILQSWAYGIPVVSTTQGARGLFARDQENLLIANTPLAFAQAVIKLLGDEMLYNRLAENGRKTVEKLYSFPAVDRLIQKTLRSTQNHLDYHIS